MQNPPHPPHQLNNSQHPTPKDVVAEGGHGVDEMMAQESKDSSEEKSEAEEREEEKRMEEESGKEQSEEVKRKEDLEKVE